jgi:alpha-tubulin suppressor-like RCC1 family protein
MRRRITDINMTKEQSAFGLERSAGQLTKLLKAARPSDVTTGTRPLRLLRGLMATAASLFALLAAPATSDAQVSGDGSISAPVFGQTLTIRTSSRFGAGISSIRWGDKEFVNNWDHGRQVATNAAFFNRNECYNPYETGSKEDGQKPTTSARVLSLSASGSRLDSSTQMCWYLSTRDPRPGFGDVCGNPADFLPCPPYTGPLSNYKLSKTVQIGYAGIPNVIDYSSVVSIPEQVQKGVVQMTAVFNKEFSNVYTYDLVSRSYRKIRSLEGEDDAVKVLATGDGAYAMGYYSPELLQQYGNGSAGGNRWGLVPPNPNYPDPDFACAGFGGQFRFESSPPANRSDRSFMVIGDLQQVNRSLVDLHNQFPALDPDVFDWREYAFINGLQATAATQASAQNNWLNEGIAKGRDAAKTFSPSEYLRLNPDIAAVFGATNYQAAIQHYISSGRSEGRGTVAKVAGGMQHLVKLTNRNALASGQNVFGQLGNGSSASSSAPSSVSGLDNSITEVAAGDYTSFAVLNDGSLWVWGSNQYGARGDGSSGDDLANPVPVPMPAAVTTPTRDGKHAVAVGTFAYAAIDNQGQVWTWGVNWNGRLGDGTTMSHYTPARVRKSSAPDDYLTGIVSIAAGGGTMAAIDADGALWTWGAGSNGALGNGSTQDSSYPVQVVKADANGVGTPFIGVREVACGSSGFCVALTRLGKVFGWGSNDFSQLGISAGGSLSIATPIAVGPASSSIDAIAVGSAHVIAHSANGFVYGWGYNGRGQLGNSSSAVAQAPPTPMSDGPDTMGDIDDLAAGGNFSAMVRSYDRAIFVAGDNQSGQLGTAGSQAPQSVPVRSSY